MSDSEYCDSCNISYCPSKITSHCGKCFDERYLDGYKEGFREAKRLLIEAANRMDKVKND